MLIEKLKDIKARFDAMPLSGKIVTGTLIAVVLSALGISPSVLTFLAGLL
jgi:hypothetical protein